MLKVLLTKLRRVVSVVHFGLLTLRYAGLRFALRKLAHQLYSRTVFLYSEGDINISPPPPRFLSITVRATEEDVQEIFNQMNNESNAGKYDLLIRKWYHERGIGTPYVQKTTDTNEVCSIRWVMTARDIENAGLQNRYPELKEDEMMFENTYVLERFRDKGIHSSSNMGELMAGLGFKRSKAFIAENNIPQLHYMRRRDRRVYARVMEHHFLFRVTRKTLERYNPPIIPEIPEGKASSSVNYLL
ncbi:MAG: hypothetical protein JSV77_06700 [Dehalococcoidales bacterium]|nr:MAG: hypothetical protein JSV77_06700 [Dehalococcoidales bacterium]